MKNRRFPIFCIGMLVVILLTILLGYLMGWLIEPDSLTLEEAALLGLSGWMWIIALSLIGWTVVHIYKDIRTFIRAKRNRRIVK